MITRITYRKEEQEHLDHKVYLVQEDYKVQQVQQVQQVQIKYYHQVYIE
jgi:hypothetical protein